MPNETTDTTKSSGPRPGLPWWVFVVAGALVVLAIGFYAGVGKLSPNKANWWGMMGDSSAPFSALFNAGALFAALWAVHLQRIESHDARLETQEQLKQFTLTAKAQRDLAKSQKQLAGAQFAANTEAMELRLAQHSNTIAIMDAALATITAAELGIKRRPPGAVRQAVADRRQAIGNRIHYELHAEATVAAKLGRLYKLPVDSPPGPTEGREDAPNLLPVEECAKQQAAKYVQGQDGRRDPEEDEALYVVRLLASDWNLEGGAHLERLGVAFEMAQSAYISAFFREVRRLDARRLV
jgi:hypothetical protein